MYEFHNVKLLDVVLLVCFIKLVLEFLMDISNESSTSVSLTTLITI